MKKFLSILTANVSVRCGVAALIGVTAASGAPRVTAAAIGIAFAVITYCLATAAREMGNQS